MINIIDYIKVFKSLELEINNYKNKIDYPIICMSEETYKFLYEHCGGYFTGTYSMYNTPIAFANWLKFGEIAVR